MASGILVELKESLIMQEKMRMKEQMMGRYIYSVAALRSTISVCIYRRTHQLVIHIPDCEAVGVEHEESSEVVTVVFPGRKDSFWED